MTSNEKTVQEFNKVHIIALEYVEIKFNREFLKLMITGFNCIRC